MRSLIVHWGGTFLILFLCTRLLSAGSTTNATVYLEEGDCRAVAAFGIRADDCKVQAGISTSLISGRQRLTFANGGWMELDATHVRAMAYLPDDTSRTLQQWCYTVLAGALLFGWVGYLILSATVLISSLREQRRN